jgi:hypothetical protein
MVVYIVTLTAVYDHGAVGVYTTLDAAKARAAELWGESDGHHDFRIDVVTVDEPLTAYECIDRERRARLLDRDKQYTGGSEQFRQERIDRLNEPADKHIHTEDHTGGSA